MGIDLPVRTITLMEYEGNNEFTNEDYQQMSLYWVNHNPMKLRIYLSQYLHQILD